MWPNQVLSAILSLASQETRSTIAPAMTEKPDLATLLGTPAGRTQTWEQINSWFHAGREPHLKSEGVQELLHLLQPKGVFFKTLPGNSCLLDVGAGDGSLHILRTWPFPPRADIKLYAFGLLKGQYYDNLDGYELGHWPQTTPRFPGVDFNAIVCSHFIEHLESPTEFIAWCAARLPEEGRIYLEWPSPCALTLPDRGKLAAVGVDLIISNYRDDPTHQGMPSREALLLALVEAGFFVEQTGVIRLPFLEDELLAHFGLMGGDAYARQFAFWSKTYWAQFIVAVKAPSRSSTE